MISEPNSTDGLSQVSGSEDNPVRDESALESENPSVEESSLAESTAASAPAKEAAPSEDNAPSSMEQDNDDQPASASEEASSDSEANAESSPAADAEEEDVDGGEDNEDDGHVEPLEEISGNEDEDLPMEWYILKVQVNREKGICEALQRRVKIEGLERYFGDILIPTEDIAEFTKTGKRRVVKRKLYPGYIVVKMAISDDTWFLVRETPGIGDFTGSAGKPTPMEAHEIERILKTTVTEEDTDTQIKTAIPFKVGDRVRVKEGYFQNFEGDVDTLDEASGRVTVMINIFGRSTPVELEHWQIEAV